MINLRKASKADAKAIWDVRASAIRAIDTQFYSKDDLEKWAPLNMPPDFEKALINHDWYVIESNNEIIATGFVDLTKGTMEAIFVNPQFQRQGFAKKMLDHLETLAKAFSLKELTLDATLNAEKFYKKHGYISKEKSIWRSPRGVNLTCIKMIKQLT